MSKIKTKMKFSTFNFQLSILIAIMLLATSCGDAAPKPANLNPSQAEEQQAEEQQAEFTSEITDEQLAELLQEIYYKLPQSFMPDFLQTEEQRRQAVKEKGTSANHLYAFEGSNDIYSHFHLAIYLFEDNSDVALIVSLYRWFDENPFVPSNKTFIYNTKIGEFTETNSLITGFSADELLDDTHFTTPEVAEKARELFIKNKNVYYNKFDKDGFEAETFVVGYNIEDDFYGSKNRVVSSRKWNGSQFVKGDRWYLDDNNKKHLYIHNAPWEVPTSHVVKEMYPTFGREISDQGAIEYKKVVDALEKVNWNPEKLTAKQQQFVKKYNIWEGWDDYYMAVGEGCSWYCGGGPDSISASSYLKSESENISYKPKNIHDLNFETAWVEGVDGYGIGEYVTYYFRQNSPRITDILIANGYVKTEKSFRENSRVKKLKMYINDKPFAFLNLKDSRNVQIFKFDPIGRPHSDNDDRNILDELPNWTMKFEILEVYKGDKYDDTAISEIYFDGIDVHCFAAETKILMSDNSLKNIELITEGDVVKSYDFENKKLTTSKVTKQIAVAHSNLLKLKLADNEIVTTADHPFWIEKNVWAAVDADKANKHYLHSTNVEKLQIGDKIFLPEKNIFSEIIDIEIINNQQLTYTLELSENDNFIANGMLVKTETVVN